MAGFGRSKDEFPQNEKQDLSSNAPEGVRLIDAGAVKKEILQY